MGKPTVWQVTWNADLACYQICEQTGQGTVVSEMEVDGDAWLEWLEQVSSFAFQSKEGTHVTALKERRGGGRVYWIAYRKVDGKLKRKYLGPSKEVTLATLEQGAALLMQTEPVTTSSPSRLTPSSAADVDVPPSSERVPPSLLITKVLVPAPAHALLLRHRLFALLDEGTRRPLTLVSAPAGFGKTSLLESWVRSLPQENLQVAWVSLDETDNDAVRFWTYVLTALDRCEPGIGQHALTLLRTPQAPALEYVLTTLINAVLPTTNAHVLILDDYHVISEPAIHTALDFLIEHQPSQLRLVLLSRSDPPLKLSRLRARGRLLEVRDDDLRCSVEEAMQFLGEVMGIRLPNDVFQQVMIRTEGWLVGLQLLGLSLRGHADPTDLLDALAGTEPQVRFWLARGETERATRWIEAQLHRLDRRPAPLARAWEELARVRVLLAQHKGEEALRYLAPLLEEATTRDWGHFVIKIRLLQALASQMQKAEREALAALAQAVHLAEPEGYLRSFVDEGSPMATLLSTLRDQQRKRGPTPYLDTVLATFISEMSTREGHPEYGGQQRPQPLLDPLSERELDVLQMLAQGASNQDIAEALVITVDTVKRHVSNILGKLEANNRMQAVIRARSLGLLSDQG